MVARVLVAPIIAMYADRMKERADVLLWSGGLSLLTAVALCWTTNFWPVLIVFSMQGATFAPYLPVVELIVISGVRRWGLDYGSMRVWGSIAFIASTLIGGEMIGYWGGSMVLPVMIFGFVTTVLMAIYCPRIGPTRRRGTPVDIPAATGSSLRQPHLLVLFWGVAIRQIEPRASLRLRLDLLASPRLFGNGGRYSLECGRRFPKSWCSSSRSI